MQYTIDVPDQLITDAVAAGARINARQAEQQRIPATAMNFDATDARDVVVGWLKGAIINDLQQQAQLDIERAVATTQQALDALARLPALPLTPSPPAP
jgi:hypothetical protein